MSIYISVHALFILFSSNSTSAQILNTYNACVKLSRYHGGIEDDTARKEKERLVRNSKKCAIEKIKYKLGRNSKQGAP